MGKLRVSAEERKKLLVTNTYLDEPSKGLELVSTLIAMPETKNETQTLLNELDRLIHENFLNLCDRESAPNSARLFEQLGQAFSDLEDLTEFHALENKNVVAVGGGFSAGKSHFLNSLMHDMILPTETTPTTSIPTYITNSEEERILALNQFNSKIPLDREALKAISHDFHRTYNVSFSHVIKILTVENPKMPFRNITFLDTPGYSKSDSFLKGNNTDKKIAKAHLSIADELIWLVDAVKGTIPSSDLQFIKDLKIKKPILVVINKADLKPISEVKKVMKETRERLDEAFIAYRDVIAYNSDKGEEIGSSQLHSFLEGINEKMKLSTVKRDFEAVFETLQKNTFEEMEKEKNQLSLLNTVYLHIDSLQNKDRQTVKEQLDKTKKQIHHLQMVITDFRTLGERVFEIVDEILKTISVKGENKEELGVVGYLRVKNKKELLQLNVGDDFTGTVKDTNHFGVFLKCGNAHEVILPMQELQKSLSVPVDKVFQKDKEVQLIVIDIEHATQTAKVICQW